MPIRRLGLWTAVPIVAIACSEGTTDFTAYVAHARFVGIVTLADSTPLGSAQVFITCGTDAPGIFGVTVTANGSGQYNRVVRAPEPVELGPGNVLECRVSGGHANAPAFATSLLSVPFGPLADSPPLTQVNLHETP